jgi:tetratricopeptide (TPR) repeat protein
LNGQPGRGLEHGLKSLRDHTALKNLEGIAAANSELSIGSYYLGQYSQGIHYSHQGIENANQSQSWRMLGYLYDYRAMLEFATGNLDSMLEFVEQAIELGKKLGQADIYATGYRLISDAFYMMEDYEKSLEHLKLAHIENQKSFIALDTLYRTKSVLFILNRDVKMIADLKDIINQAEVTGLITGKLLAQISLMFAYRTLQEWEKASDLANEIKAVSHARGFRSFVIAANLTLAQSEWQSGHHAIAFGFLNESIQEAERLPFIWLEIMGRILLVHFSQQSGQPTEANRQRITHLIQNLQHNCQKSLFKSSLQAYTKRLEQLLA